MRLDWAVAALLTDLKKRAGSRGVNLPELIVVETQNLRTNKSSERYRGNADGQMDRCGFETIRLMQADEFFVRRSHVCS